MEKTKTIPDRLNKAIKQPWTLGGLFEEIYGASKQQQVIREHRKAILEHSLRIRWDQHLAPAKKDLVVLVKIAMSMAMGHAQRARTLHGVACRVKTY